VEPSDEEIPKADPEEIFESVRNRNKINRDMVLEVLTLTDINLE
jgi:hypothetical protein